MRSLKNILISIILLSVISASLPDFVFAETAAGVGALTGSEAAATAGKAVAISENIAVLGPALGAVTGLTIGCESIFPAEIVVCIDQIPETIINAQNAFNTGLISGESVASDIRAKGSLLSRIIDFAQRIAYILFKKVILDRLVDAMVNWINNDGKGGIISNWNQFFQDSANQAAGEFVQQLGPPANFLCSPFNLQLQLALLPVDRFSKVTCTLNSIVSNIDNFIESFRNGSWLAYQETWYPKNNFYGATIIATDEMAKAAAEGKEAATNEGLAGSGFLSKWKDDYYIDNNGPYKDKQGTFAPTGYQGIRYNKGRVLVTPGSIAAQAVVESTFTIPGNRLIHADDMTVYLTAIINAAVNKLVQFGINGLKDALASGLKDTKINPAFPCAGLTADAFTACMQSVNAEKQSFTNTQADVIGVTAGSLTIRAQLASIYQQSINLQTSYVNALNNLITIGKGADRQLELANEQNLLDSLIVKRDGNQSFIEALTAQADKITSATTSTAITPNDYVNLGQNTNTQYASDATDATQELGDAKKELNNIQSKINSNLAGILNQLPESMKSTTTPATTP